MAQPALAKVPTAVVVGVGAERGLGTALCRRFAVEGYHALVAGRTPVKIARVARIVVEEGGKAEPVPTGSTTARCLVADRATRVFSICL